MRGVALLKYITSRPLAVMPSYLDVITTLIQEWQEGTAIKLDANAVSNSQTGDLSNSQTSNSQQYDVNAGNKSASHTDSPIAVLSYRGAISKYSSGLESLSGGISTRQIRQDVEAALNDSRIKGIVLSLDSPGGTVDGTKELGDYLMSVRGQKPIVTYADGLMCSGAYWIGCCADAIVAYDTTQVGSIGVITTHLDISKAMDKEGVKATIIKAGKYKALGNKYEPLSDEDEAMIQEDVDYYYSMFVNHVATARQTDVKTVLKEMAEGRVFIGTKAKEAGLVDHIGSIEDAIQLTLDLGGINVKKEVQDVLMNGDLPEVLSTLASRKDLPADVKTQITSVLTPVEKVEVEKSHYDSLVADLASLQSQLEATQAKLEDAETKIAELEDAKVKAEKQDSIKQLFADSTFEVTDELLETLMGMDIEKAKVVATSLIKAKADADAVATALTIDSGGTSDQATTEPTTMDEAVNIVATENPDMEINDVIKAASKKYPEFFKKK